MRFLQTMKMKRPKMQGFTLDSKLATLILWGSDRKKLKGN